MPVTTIAVDQLVLVFLIDGSNADGNGFLAAVNVAEAADFLNLIAELIRLGFALIFLVGPLFESADEHHHPQAVAFGGAAAGVAIGGTLRRPVGLGPGTQVYFVGYGHSRLST